MTDLEKAKLYCDTHIKVLSGLLTEPDYNNDRIKKAILETRADTFREVLDWLNRLESKNDSE